jgi:hypothetical protein
MTGRHYRLGSTPPAEAAASWEDPRRIEDDCSGIGGLRVVSVPQPDH